MPARHGPSLTPWLLQVPNTCRLWPCIVHGRLLGCVSMRLSGIDNDVNPWACSGLGCLRMRKADSREASFGARQRDWILEPATHEGRPAMRILSSGYNQKKSSHRLMLPRISRGVGGYVNSLVNFNFQLRLQPAVQGSVCLHACHRTGDSITYSQL